MPNSITELGLSSCLTSPEYFAGIEKSLPRLSTLNLEMSAKVSDRDISHICKCQNLEVLNLNGCYRVTDSAIEAIARTQSSLRELHLKDTKCSDISLFHISSHLKSLQKLSLGGMKETFLCKMSSKGMSCNLIGLKQATAFDLSYSCCDDDVLKALNCLKTLTSLDVRVTSVTQQGVDSFSEHCKIVSTRDT